MAAIDPDCRAERVRRMERRHRRPSHRPLVLGSLEVPMVGWIGEERREPLRRPAERPPPIAT
jgi:hypothetical protein